jgi:hypothetical protein
MAVNGPFGAGSAGNPVDARYRFEAYAVQRPEASTSPVKPLRCSARRSSQQVTSAALSASQSISLRVASV